jgi:hypothetical protein
MILVEIDIVLSFGDLTELTTKRTKFQVGRYWKDIQKDMAIGFRLFTVQ